jgi:SAM-dependent methyltransferase
MFDPIVSQLRHPRGPLAPITSAVLNVVNRPINRWTQRALELTGSERVLDVGFGGGVGLALVLPRLTTGRAAGIDISEEMVQRGAARFSREIADGTLRLVRAGVEAMPFEDASFDRAYTVNTIFFWPDIAAGLRELHRVLAPDARLVIAAPASGFAMARAFGLSPDPSVAGPEQARSLAQAAGFKDVQVRRKAGAALIVARRAAR